MAQALPSFVELLVSLELESDKDSEVKHYAHYPTSPSFISSSPSSSLSSFGPSSKASPGRPLNSAASTSSFTTPPLAIVISQASPVEGSVNPRRRSSNRYNPYAMASQNIFSRRCSLPGHLDSPHDTQKPDSPTRASSSSPPMRRVSLDPSYHDPYGSRPSSTRAALLKTDQPISTHVRRLRHSNPSSQSPGISNARRRSVSPTQTMSPLSLPSLPPLPPISTGNGVSPSWYQDSDFPGLPPISALNPYSQSPRFEGSETEALVGRVP